MDNLSGILYNILYAVVAVMFAWIAKKVADVLSKDMDDDKEIEDNSNTAVGIRRAGLYLGGMIAMAGVLIGESQGLVPDLIGIGIYGALAYVLLFISQRISDKVLMGAVNNDDECRKGNNAVGIVEFGNYVATGMILNACVAGDGGGMVNGIIGTVVFFAIGQVLLLAYAGIYEAITPFKAKAEIAGGNAAAAIMIAGKSIALGLILRHSIIGESMGLVADIKAFGISAVTGIVLLLVFNKAIDHLFLPNTNLRTEVERDRNIAAVTVTQLSTIGVALIISMIV